MISSAASARVRTSCAPWYKGPEEKYALGEAIARAIYAPVLHSHRCAAEQTAILEPVLSETVLGTCLTIVRDAMDEAVKRGVPETARARFLAITESIRQIAKPVTCTEAFDLH